MPISARVLADSIAPTGKRLTTLECTYPRVIHAELLTHRLLSRNSASSRAIPIEKLIQRVIDDPFIPSYIGANQKGMQAGAELSEDARREAVRHWSYLRDTAVAEARHLSRLGVHKQVVNRMIEPWMWITIIVSATEWDNFFGLRDHKDAEPHFQDLARQMRAARDASVPRQLKAGEWHLPMVDIDAVDTAALDEFANGHIDAELFTLAPRIAVRIMVSVGRCARVSYLTHDGRRDIMADVELYRRMAVQEPLHASPAEHAAQALEVPMRVGNFIGWKQLRKFLPNEHIGGPMP